MPEGDRFLKETVASNLFNTEPLRKEKIMKARINGNLLCLFGGWGGFGVGGVLGFGGVSFCQKVNVNNLGRMVRAVQINLAIRHNQSLR
ncbi:MAG: hypothetical protein U5R30_00965 [Deltaproteobacteria bacterium]|nr:hypothetical protein [Deltaproteobacteria bacterium]